MPQSDNRKKGKSVYDPSRPDHPVNILTANYEGLKKMYPCVNLKAMINKILEEHIKNGVKF